MTARVLVLYTGGTIGMVPSAQGFVPAPDLRRRVLGELGGLVDRLPQHDLLELAPLIDSANLSPEDWSRIGTALVERWQDYDGFVVLHGTDTLAYTASALSFMLAGQDKPVILTGAQIPLGQLRSDARDNLVTSLLLAARPEISEVCVYFHGRLLRGNRARKVRASGFDAFDSPNFPWLGEAGIGLRLRDDLLLAPGTPDFTVPRCQAGAVAMATVYPGMSAQSLQSLLTAPGVRGLVLQSYGVGNLPAADTALLQVLAEAVAAGTTVVNVSQCLNGEVQQGAYATGAALDAAGVLPGLDLTPEAAFAKLHLLLARGLPAPALRRAMSEPIRGECSPG
ncbi:type I asparaginase [Marinobacter lutaoensis]|jgi:L-asparaginase|uniref:asparaginase n=1 Tax=Marinobacter lutaoensis TaxID=135739 RepID=A0A1V2DSV7_9GAMM|nr:type I asparaginase [Marinobacter lutaoensis]NVD35867.1 type I asparaginase [Marinobacter lutaoensis]ONF43550.1 L-asparaginase 1 [Marinobacter lutaoensis]